MINELERYVDIIIVGIASILFWFFSQPTTKLAAWQMEGGGVDLPAVSSVEFFGDKELKRDPFQILSAPVAAKKSGSKPSKYQIPDIYINGIVFSDEDPLAYINGKLYRKGENFKGLKIVKIFTDRVQFSVQGRIIERKLPVPDMGIVKE
jgi:hypothetical protein